MSSPATLCAQPRCVYHPDRPSRVNLDSEELCQECADAWVRGEAAHAAWLEAEAACNDAAFEAMNRKLP